MSRYRVVEFGKPVRGKFNPAMTRAPAEQLQELLDQEEEGTLAGVVPLAYGALLIFTR